MSFKNTEQLGLTEFDRKAVYDIYCESESGEKFIVELQKAKQNYFIDRTIYYSTFPIREQAEKGFWNYKLKAVYCVGILDFTFDDYESEPERSEVVHTVQLKNQYGKVFYDKLTYIYLEMPNFLKMEQELQTRLEKWLYFIKHLEDFQSIPTIFRDEVFEQAFETAELARFNPVERDSYEMSLKVARDNKNTFDYAMDQARNKGLEKGIAEGIEKGIVEGTEKGRMKKRAEVVKIARQMGLSVQAIAQLTGLSADEINSIL